MKRTLFFATGGVFCITALSACDAIKDALDDTGVLGDLSDVVGTCGEACANIQICGDEVSPPEPSLPGGLGNPDVELPSIAECAANCAAPNRVELGYADCQIACIENSSCGQINDCWNVSSARYSSFCDIETTPIEPSEEEASSIDNDTTTGSAAADSITDNPAVEESVESSGTVLHYGDDPPAAIANLWTAAGTIDASSNARDVGSPINTRLCFYDMTETAEGWEVSYCEQGVVDGSGNPLSATAPITGEGDGWSIFLEFPGTGSIIFSGELAEGASSMSDVDALVTYYHGMEIWEHSYTDWNTSGDSCSIDDCR
tara:strand:- start:392 stop:1339 length:948 start_codon:yes stop_codon:yes gene_type:complete